MKRRKRKQEIRLQIANDNNWVCHICGNEIADKYDLTLDHVIPLAKGGADELHNIKPAHRKCNELKADNETVEQGDLYQIWVKVPEPLSGGFTLADLFPTKKPDVTAEPPQ